MRPTLDEDAFQEVGVGGQSKGMVVGYDQDRRKVLKTTDEDGNGRPI